MNNRRLFTSVNTILCLTERRTKALGRFQVFSLLAFSQCADMLKKVKNYLGLLHLAGVSITTGQRIYWDRFLGCELVSRC